MCRLRDVEVEPRRARQYAAVGGIGTPDDPAPEGVDIVVESSIRFASGRWLSDDLAAEQWGDRQRRWGTESPSQSMRDSVSAGVVSPIACSARTQLFQRRMASSLPGARSVSASA